METSQSWPLCMVQCMYVCVCVQVCVRECVKILGYNVFTAQTVGGIQVKQRGQGGHGKTRVVLLSHPLCVGACALDVVSRLLKIDSVSILNTKCMIICAELFGEFFKRHPFDSTDN